MKKILVTGGSGYIGSHTVVDLIDNGYEAIIVDNHSNSLPKALDGIEKLAGKRVKNYDTNLCDLAATRQIFEENPDIVGIIHFAAHIYVNESVEKPVMYFENNLYSLLNIMTCMSEYKVPNIIFSSSCSVYGNAKELPVTEKTPFNEAESPYARTKQIGEQMLKDYSRSDADKNAVVLRYFNPAGAHPTAIIGEEPLHTNTHLIPVITEVASGKRKEMKVFGTDYETRDGSCIRDYIHVMDLASAHTKAIGFLLEQKNESNFEIFNLGIGEGVSVLEAINAFEKVTGVKLNYKLADRRDGDVGAIYAVNERATTLLGWSPQYDIESIMKTAWDWEHSKTSSAVH